MIDTSRSLRSRFEALDINNNENLTFEEFQQMTADLKHGTAFLGKARIPFEEELASLDRRMRKKKNCAALVFYLLFLAIYCIILACYPISIVGKMVLETKDWISGLDWGDDNSLDDIRNADDFWQWFNEVVVSEVWDGDAGILLGYNSIVGGVTIGKRTFEYSESCSPFESKMLQKCPHIVDGTGFDDTSVNKKVKSVLPKFTPYRHTDRSDFELQYFPLMKQLSNGSYVDVSKNETLEEIDTLLKNGWMSGGTDELVVVMIMYNENTHLYLTLEIRFRISEVGGVNYEVLTESFVLDPLSKSITEAHGAPWEVRVVFEIMFVIFIFISLVREIYEFVVSCIRGVENAIKDEGMPVLGGLKGVWGYFWDFWNLVDLALIGLGIYVVVQQIQLYFDHRSLREFLESTIGDGKITELDGQLLTAHFLRLGNSYAVFRVFNTLCMLIAFFRVFKYLEFHLRLGVVTRTIRIAWPKLIHFGFVLIVFVSGYAAIGWILFASRSAHFRTMTKTMGTMGNMLTDGIDYAEFVDMVQGEDLNTWAWLPMTLYYYGFTVIVFMLMMNILLGIVIGSYDVVREELDNLDPKRDTIWNDICSFAFRVKKALGLHHDTPKNSSKVGPMRPILNKSHAEQLRPALKTVERELCFAKHFVLNPDELEKQQRYPFQRIESRDPLVVYFTYSDLTQIFSDKVAKYLWAQYGPGNEPDDGETGNLEEVVIAAEENKLSETKEKMEEMQKTLNDILTVILRNPNYQGPDGSNAQHRVPEMIQRPPSVVSSSEEESGEDDGELDEDSAIRNLLNTLLANGPYPLNKIKEECNSLQYPWEKVKIIRREMGICQYKHLQPIPSATDLEQPISQVIRLWKFTDKQK